MDEIKREKEAGFDFEYLGDVPAKKEEVGDKFQTPGFGLAAQLFSSVAKFVIEKLGEEEGEAVLKKGIEYFGLERGKRIAERVKAQGKENSFKNWLIYTDIDSVNFQPIPSIEDNNLVAKVNNCTFYNAAEEWGLGEYAKIYCKYVDYKILEGYNPDVKMSLKERQATGEDHCVFTYIMKEANK
ncbi:MAG: L-2-amino-thiazoline-4-carboxylic acid hydrolase [Deltaproteobacteria bacterium]|uniref:L-2-amino-thiazoline-4-carboxylic acid hydrolase n=1 Tax=Candidatus Zymogenus saltonus TaxID=2844893 RepID=A0A9D8PQ20_9DELT|nr:L-2-amino-thiazoline-4-carboxylic acid hydrolase [Candidatus Zymogenus saltonus]